MPRLVRPSVALQDAWLRCHQEWGPGLHEDGFGLDAGTSVTTAAGFAEWVRQLHAEEDASIWHGPAIKACRYRWILDGDEVVGGIAARAGNSDLVRRDGHAGTGSDRLREDAVWPAGHWGRWPGS